MRTSRWFDGSLIKSDGLVSQCFAGLPSHKSPTGLYRNPCENCLSRCIRGYVSLANGGHLHLQMSIEVDSSTCMSRPITRFASIMDSDGFGPGVRSKCPGVRWMVWSLTWNASNIMTRCQLLSHDPFKVMNVYENTRERGYDDNMNPPCPFYQLYTHPIPIPTVPYAAKHESGKSDKH